MKRERLEDLGRIAEKLRVSFESDQFDVLRGCPKDFADRMTVLSEDDRSGVLREVAYSFESLRDVISDCLAIAEGRDGLNDS